MAESTTPEALYLDLLKKCLTRFIFGESYRLVQPPRGGFRRALYVPTMSLLAAWGVGLVRRVRFDPAARTEGLDWPAEAETMIGLRRLDNLERCIVDVLEGAIPGDLIEAGVWRGGAAIFMRAVLKAYGDTQRVVWAADSFQGLPKPDPGRYPADAGDRHWTRSQLAVPIDDVKRNFARYGLLDEQVRFLVGWFRDTLPVAPIERLSVLRIDGDMYESTSDALHSLYPKLSVGGYLIIDDYALPGCRSAVDDFRTCQGVVEPMEWIDRTGVFWRRRT